MKQLALLFVCLLAFATANSQDKMLMLSGAVIDGKVTSVNDSLVHYEEQKKGKVKQRAVDVYRVYSIEYADGKETVVYEQDTTVGNYFSPEEMKLFIYGEQDAHDNYPAKRAFALGFLYGAGGGLVLPESFWVFLVPVSSGVVGAVPKIKITPKRTRDTKLLQEPAYVMGYERTARARKIQNTMKGSVLGTLLSVVGYHVVKNNTD